MMPMPKSGGVAGQILDKMDAKSAPMAEDEASGNDMAAESAFSDFAAAVKSGNGPAGVAALRELLSFINGG